MEDEELQRVLSQMTTLEVVRVFIDRHALELPTPSHELDHPHTTLATLAQRATSLYANFYHSLESPVELAPVLAIRPLIELAILTKWLSINPELNTFLYVADSMANEQSHLNAIYDHARERGTTVSETAKERTPQREAMRAEALARLKAANKNYGKGTILPNLRRMADEVIVAIPGHKMVMNDAYIYAYKTFSPWEHSEASSFNANGKDTGPETWEWIGDKSPWQTDDLEAIASAHYAYVLETVFAFFDMAEETAFARMLRDHVLLSPRENVQPPGGKADVSENR